LTHAEAKLQAAVGGLSRKKPPPYSGSLVFEVMLAV